MARPCSRALDMPLRWEQPQFAAAYSDCRASGRAAGGRHAALLVAEVWHGRPPASVLVAGSGYGDLVAALDRRGLEAWGVDASDWIASQIDRHGAIPWRHIQACLGEPGSRILIAERTDRVRWDCVVTEALVESYDPAREPAAWRALLNDLDALSGHIVHLVHDHRPGAVPVSPDVLPLCWQPLAAWCAAAPTHIWISAISGEVRR